jgi:hypothetical protein
VFADAGLVIDADTPDVYGTGDVGPVYGEPQWSNPHIWLELARGTNEVLTTGEVDGFTLEYQDRWSV